MPVSPNPITGWAESPITSVHYAHDLATYEIIATSGSASALNTAHAFYSLSKDIKRWVWEIEIIGTTDIDSRTIAGVSLAKTGTTLPFSLFGVPPGTVYESNGTIINTDLVFDPYGDGDLLTFIIDYEDKVLLAYLNGVFQGAMLTPENFPPFSSPFFPFFATSESGIGCRIQDGAPTSISKDTLTFNLRDPIDPMAPADDSLSPPIKVNFQTAEQYGIDIVDMQAAAVDEGFITTVDALAYYSNNPNIMQIAGLTQQESYPPLSTQFDMQIPPYRLDVISNSERFYWNQDTSVEGTRVSNENVTASNEIVGLVKTNSFKNSGNVYWECKIIEGGENVSIGVGSGNADINRFVGDDDDSWGIFGAHRANGGIITDHISPVVGDGDIVNVAMDLDKNLLWFGVNGVWLDSGNPTLGLNPTFTNVIGPMYPMASSTINSYWIVDGYFSNFNIEYSIPAGYVAIDNSFEPVVFPRPIVKWDADTATLNTFITQETTFTENGTGSTLTEGNLNARFDGSAESFLFSSRPQISGKKYIEFKILDGEATSLSTFVGLSTLPSESDDILTNGPEKYVIHVGSNSTPDRLRSNFGVEHDEGNKYFLNDIVMMAVDFDSGKVWFGVNGEWDNGNPIDGTLPIWSGPLGDDYFFIVAGDESLTSTGQLKANFGAEDFIFDAPSGYESWNSESLQGWNPSNTPPVVSLDATRLIVNGLGSNTTYSGIGSLGHESGKHYFEIKVNSLDPLAVDSAQVGVGRYNVVEAQSLGSTTDSWSIWQLNGTTSTGGVPDNTDPIIWNTVNDVVMVAVDSDSGEMWFGVNGAWLSGSNPATGTNPRYNNLSGMIFPAFGNNSLGVGDLGTLTLNLTGPFSYTVPNTFDSWDTPSILMSGMTVSPNGLTASGTGSVIADHIVNEDDTEQFYMEFTVGDDTDLMGIGVEAHDPSLLVAHQYWRIATSDTVSEIDITEIDLIDHSSSPNPIDIDSLNVISSGEFDPGYAAEYAFNGTYTVQDEFEAGVRWRSDNIGTVVRWLGVDFTETNEKRISHINVKGGFSFTTEWDIQYSDDGILWTTIKSEIDIPLSTTKAIVTDIDDTIETMLYQSNGALGTLDERPNVALDPTNSSATWQFFKDDIQAADIGLYGTSKATFPSPIGKSYCEIKIESPSDVAAVIVGMAPTVHDNDEFPGQTTGFGWNGGTGNIWVDGTEFPFTAPYTVGDIINIAVDTITGDVWLGLNGVWTAGDPELGTGAIITGLVGDYWVAVGDATNTLSETVAYTSNFGQFVFANTQPNGFGTYGPIAGAGNFASYATGDVIGLSIDSDTGDIWWSVNGTSIAGDFVAGTDKPAYSFEHLKIKFAAVDAEMTANYGSELFDQAQFRTFESFGCGDGGFSGSSPCLSTEDLDQITVGFLIVNINDVGDRFFGVPQTIKTDFALNHTMNPTYENSLINSYNIVEEFTLFSIDPAIDTSIVGLDPILIDISFGINGGEIPPFAIQVPLTVAIAGFGIPLPPEDNVINVDEELAEYTSPFILKIPFGDIFNPTQIIKSSTSIETDHVAETIHTPIGWPQPTEFAIPEVSGNHFNDVRTLANFLYHGASNLNTPNVHLMVNQITTMPFNNTEVTVSEPVGIAIETPTAPVGHIAVSETPIVQRIVYLEPVYPDKTSGRIGGGGA